MAGLFDFQDPRQIRSDYMNSQMVSPAQMGNQDLYSKLASTMANAGTMIGTGIGGMMGGVLPKEAEQRRVQEVMKGVDLTSPESILKGAAMFTQMGDSVRALELTEQADIVGQRQFRAKEQQAKVLSMNNDKKAKEAVAALPTNASSEQILAAIRPYVGVDSVYKGVLAKEEKLAAMAAKAEELKLRHQQRMDEIASQNASREQIAAENARFRAMMAQSQNEIRLATLDLRRDTLNAKNGTLPATLQKAEQGDLEQYDSRGDEIELMNKALTELRGTEGQKPLVLGPFQNKKYEAQNATGFSTPESRRYAGIQSAYKTAVNTKVSAEKGVQTDKDVVRFAEALIAAYSGNDFDALQKATVDYTDAVKRSRDTLQKRIQGRRKNAGTPFYDFGLQDGETPEATSGTTKTTASGVKYTVREK